MVKRERVISMIPNANPNPLNPKIEEEDILMSLKEAKLEIDQVFQRFEYATDPYLIDSCIYEIKALQLKYEYLRRQIKNRKVEPKLENQEVAQELENQEVEQNLKN